MPNQPSPFEPISDSNALRACNDVGARLPTVFEFKQLLEEFDHILGPPCEIDGISTCSLWSKFPKLTEKGYADFKAVFNDVTDERYKRLFWIGSWRHYAFGPTVAYSANFSGHFDTDLDSYDLGERSRESELSVRCVRN
jgi:hypothetical protein